MVDTELPAAPTAEQPGYNDSLPAEAPVPDIRILLADEPSVFRDGLRALLMAERGLTVVAVTADAEAIVDLAHDTRPDIILFEPSGAQGAMSVLQRLQDSRSPARVILLTSVDDPDQLSNALRHGVAGIVSKRESTEFLLKSIRKVRAGELWLDRSTTASVVRQLAGRPIPMPRTVSPNDKPVALSRREREIVCLVAQGFRNREIADKLFISEQTVKNHMHNIFEKVGVQDRLELALYAIYHRLHEPEA